MAFYPLLIAYETIRMLVVPWHLIYKKDFPLVHERPLDKSFHFLIFFLKMRKPQAGVLPLTNIYAVEKIRAVGSE